MKKLILSLLLFSTLVSAQPQNFLAGTNINIDASKGVSVCSGTGDIKLATSCTGGGTQYNHIFNGTTGVFSSTGGMSLPNGTAAAPALTFTSDTDTGIYRIGANNIGVSVGGTGELNLTSSALSPVAASGLDNGTSALPWKDAYIADNIIMSSASSKIGIGTTDAADSKILYISGAGSNSDTRAAQCILSGNEAAGSPGVAYLWSGNVANAYTDYDARHSGGYHSFKVAGAEKTRINASGQNLGSDGTVLLPTYSFSADTDTGVYSSAADVLSISSGGTSIASVLSTGLRLDSGTLIASNSSSLAMTGTTQSDAVGITNMHSYLSGADNVVGARLPASAPVGATYIIRQPSGGGTAKLYPPTGEVINSLAANANITMGARTTITCTKFISTEWICSTATNPTS